MYFFVYILASLRNGTLYVGMTDDLARRYLQHRNGEFPGFTKRYGVKLLVWFEEHGSRESAFTRERQIKKWRRKWKLELIERMNPRWLDLGSDFHL
jgi:putative endonuclease